MALKDTWNDLIDGESEIGADDINEIANAVIELEEQGVAKAPYVGDNGNWYEWNVASQSYVDTGTQAQGDDGYTPVKGKDYFTEKDKAELVQDVLSLLPNGDEVSY